jgi:hypothetical protein
LDCDEVADFLSLWRIWSLLGPRANALTLSKTPAAKDWLGHEQALNRMIRGIVLLRVGGMRLGHPSAALLDAERLYSPDPAGARYRLIQKPRANCLRVGLAVKRRANWRRDHTGLFFG